MNTGEHWWRFDFLSGG